MVYQQKHYAINRRRRRGSSIRAFLFVCTGGLSWFITRDRRR